MQALTAIDAPYNPEPLKCYIAGPMTDCDNYNHESFIRAREIVLDHGFYPVTPFDIDDEIDHSGYEWSDYLRMDLRRITESDVIALLPGWEESKGARLEYDTAVRLELLPKEVDLENGALLPHDPGTDEGPPTILEEAQRLVYGPREADYGHPFDDYTKTAALWSAILETEVTAKEAALCMVAVKISREVHRPKRDNLIDMAGYAAVADRIDRHPDS